MVSNFATFYLNAGGTADGGTGWDVMLRHLDHLIAEAGEDHVGLGSDFDGCVLPDLIGDVTGVPLLFEAMGAHGYDAALLDKLARDKLARLPRPVPSLMRWRGDIAIPPLSLTRALVDRLPARTDERGPILVDAPAQDFHERTAADILRGLRSARHRLGLRCRFADLEPPHECGRAARRASGRLAPGFLPQ